MKRLWVWKWLVVLACAWSAAPLWAAIPVYGYVVKNSYPHDPAAFTQGLVYRDGVLFESTGLNGHSSLRKVQLETGKVLMKKDIAAEYFGEGIAVVGDEVVSLTWQSQVGFVFDARDFSQKRQFSYPGEGWGLTNDAAHIYMSDGTEYLRVLDPKTLAEQRRIRVLAEGRPIPQLNELEWVDGEIFANVWGSDVVARIDPASGEVRGWIDLTGLLAPRWRGIRVVDVLNGIAYDAKHKRLFVTGKLWPRLFEIELVLKKMS